MIDCTLTGEIKSIIMICLVYCFAFIWNSECHLFIDSSICFWIWSHFEISFRNWKCKNYTIMYRQYSDVTVNKTAWRRLNRKHLVIEWWNILQLLQLHVQIHKYTTMQIWSISKNVKFQQIKASDITKNRHFKANNKTFHLLTWFLITNIQNEREFL